MKLKYLLLLNVFYFIHNNISAQNACASDIIYNQRIQSDYPYKRFVDSFNHAIRINRNSIFKIDSIANFPDTIPIVVHIVHNGDTIGSRTNPNDQKIIDLINFTNSFYDSIGIHFILARRDEQCNSTTGIDRIDGGVLPDYYKYGVALNNTHGTSRFDLYNLFKWNPNKYYNIWIVTSIDGGAFSGFASYPGSNDFDGAVIINSAVSDQNTTLAHELGHSFFLMHTFQGSNGNVCPLNNDCAMDGDKICDTDPVTPSSYPRNGINPCTNTPFTDNTEKNIMSYSEQQIFTTDQISRMHAAAMLPSRDTLTKSLGKYKPDNLTCDLTLHLEGQLIKNDILLTWKYPASLPKNKIWIERSYDGFLFKVLGSIQPTANHEDYSFKDPDITQQYNFYRLLQIMDNGIPRYSNTVTIKNLSKFSNSFIVLGNPIRNNQIDIQFGNFEQLSFISGSVTYNSEIYILDVTGRVVYHTSTTITSFQRYRIQLNNIPSGMYFIKMVVNNNVYVNKLIKN